MQNSSLDYMHRLLAESLYRGYSGGAPSHKEATDLAARSVQWLRELLLRLSIQSCLDATDPIANAMDEPGESGELARPDEHGEFSDFDAIAELTPWSERRDLSRPRAEQLHAIHSRDERLWQALCEGRLVLRIEGSKINASVVQRLPHEALH